MLARTDTNAGIRSRLQVAIQERNTTPKAVSVAAGFPPSYVGNMLRRSFGPSTDRTLKLAKTLNVSLDWLVCGKGPMCRDEVLRRHIATQILKAIEAGQTTRAEIGAYVREHSGSYEITDERIEEAAHYILDIWQERGAPVPESGGHHEAA